MRKLYVLLLALFVGMTVNAQLSGTKNIPGDYADLTAAITAVNTQGVGSGGVTLNLLAGNPQTAPAGGYVIGGSGTAVLTSTSSVNQVILQGNGNTVTASGSLTSGALNDAIFKIIGADWITVTGFVMTENTANTTTTAASNNMTEWGVALLYVTTTDGAQNNTLQGNTIDLNRTYQNTFGVYSNSTHSATAVTTSATATTTAGGNNNLKVYGNNITDVNIGIVVVGPTAAADNNDGLDIGGTAGTTGNSITNYGTTGTFSGYANVSGTVNGILVRNTKNFNVSYNTVTSSNGGTTSGTLRGIYVPSFSNAPTGTIVNTINYNTISVNTAVASGTLQGIVVESSTTNATTSLSINNNGFGNTNYTVAGTGAVTLISNASAALTTNINNNTFTALSINTTGNVTFIINNVTRPANAICNVNNNSIVTSFAKTAAGGTVNFYTSNSTSPTTASETNSGNNFSNITVTGGTLISGWISTDGSSTSPFGPGKTISGNTFTNITGGTSAITLLTVGYSNSGSSANNVFGNVIGNVSNGASITGITSPAGSQNFFSNTIYGLATTGAASVSGQVISGGTLQNVYKTKIYDLQSNNASGTVNGLLVSSGTTVNVYNNLIGDLRTPTANAANPLIGISVTGGTTVNVYFNTVYLNGSSTGALFGSSALSASTTPALTLNNNIFVNLSTPAGATGYSSAYRRSSTTLTSYANSSNNNLFYAGTPSATNLIFYDGTNADQTLAAYKTRTSPRDGASISENPPFASTTGASAAFLHLTAGSTTGIESGGANISGITDDYDAQTRAGNAGYSGTGSAPDIGGDEFEGTPTGTPCTAPADQATALVFGTTTATTQPGSFTAAASSPTGYLIVRSIGALTSNPVNGTGYAAGNALGNGTVVQGSSAMSFTATGLTANTNYTYTVFAYNSSGCIGGPIYNTTAPLTGSFVTCPATPASAGVSNIATNSFVLNFTSSKGGGANSVTYNLEVATDAAFTTPVAGSPFTFSDTTTVQSTMSYKVSGLSASTTHYYRLKANGCNTATVSGNLITTCAAATLPLNEGFNGTALPACWASQFVSGSKAFSVGNATTAAGTDPNPAPYEGAGRLLFPSYTSSGNQTRLVSPPLTSTGTASVDVNFAWYHSSLGGATSYLTEGVQVQYSTDGTSWTNAGSLIRRYDAATGWVNKSVTLPAAAGNQSMFYVGFLFTSNAGYDSYVDALSIAPTPTTPCAAPADQASGLTFGAQGTTSQAGSFTAAASTPSGYLVVRSAGALNTTPVDGTAYTSGAALGNGTVVQSSASTSFTATGLAGNTEYTFTVFSFNNTACVGGPAYNRNGALSGNSITCPATPSSVSVSNLSSTSFILNWTSSKGGSYVNPIDYTVDVATDNAFANPVAGSPFTVTDSTTNQTTMRFMVSGLTSTTTYYYRIKASGCNAAYSSTSSTTTLGAPPANDDAVNATVLTIGAGCTGSPYTNLNATQGVNEPYATCKGSAAGYSTVWFSFVAPASGAVKISNDFSGGTMGNDSRLSLYSATDAANYGTFTLIGCDDDNGITISSRSTLYATSLTPGITYYVQVDGYSNTTTTGTFCIAVDELTSAMLSPSGTCTSGESLSSINTGYTGWLSMVDASGRLIAQIKDLGGNGGTFDNSVTVNTAAVRQNAGIYYLNRNFRINNSTSTNVKIQFFFLNTELNALNAVDGTTLASLGVTRQSGTTCRTNFTTVNGTSSYLTQTANGTFNGLSFIEVNSPGFSNFYLNKAGSVLPANLLTFSGARQGSSNVLKWTVAQEQNVQVYQIERSETGRNWSVAGSVNSLGNTSGQRSYTFSDNNTAGLRQYYRLRQVDHNGLEKLSNVVLINGAKPTSLTLVGLFPNPAVSKVNVLVDAPAKDNVTIVVMDAAGRTIKTQKAGVDAGSNTVEMNVAGLAAGSYLLKVTCESNCQSATLKFTKE